MKKSKAVKLTKTYLLKSEIVKEGLNSQSKKNHQNKRAKLLQASISCLTDHEIKILLSECIEIIDNSKSSFLLCFSLLSGKSLEYLLSLNDEHLIRNSDEFNGLSVISYPLSITERAVDNDEIGVYQDRPSSKVKIVFPKILSDQIKLIDFSSLNQEKLLDDAKELLLKINKNNQTHLTLGKIAKYYSFYLKDHNVSDVFVELFENPDVYECAGVYYCTFKLQEIINVHQEYITHLFRCARISYIPISVKTALQLGSKFRVKTHKVAQLFETLERELNQYKRNTFANAEKVHNVLVLYTIAVLNISTGHRAVNDPYDSLDTFSLSAGEVIIEDKKNQHRETARIVHLPLLAVKQVKAYIKHLKVLSRLNSVDINTILKGQSALFFFIDGDKKIAITPEVFQKKTMPFLNTKANWYRHFMYSYLHDNHVQSPLISAWMGHHGKHEINFNRFSDISTSSMKDIATLIDDLLNKELLVTVQKGLSNE